MPQVQINGKDLIFHCHTSKVKLLRLQVQPIISIDYQRYIRIAQILYL